MKETNKWQLIWSDEFSEKTINPNNWNFQVEEAGRFNKEWQRYTDSPKNAFIENNCLVIKAIHQSNKHGLNQYTAARLNTVGKFSFKYGKIAARIRLPQGEGIWPAFWMLGNDIDENGGTTPWPLCGEIDILELYGSRDNGVVEANIHYADKDKKHMQMGAVPYKLPKGKFADNFHVFELEWNKKEFIWLVDGKSYLRKEISSKEFAVFHKEKFFLLLNIAVGGEFSGRPNTTTEFPQCMYVDWVRVYQKK